MLMERSGALTFRKRINEQRLDVFKHPELVLEAAKAFRAQVGTGNVLLKILIYKQGISFTTNLPYQLSSEQRRLLSSTAAYALYTWDPYNFCGGCVEEVSWGSWTYGAEKAPNPSASFSIDEGDLTIVPKLIAAAKEKLDLQEGQITGMELKRPEDAVSGAALSWKVKGKAKNEETGSIQTDLSENVQQVHPAPPRDWLTPYSINAALSRMVEEYGPYVKMTSIEFSNTRVTFVAEDPQHTGEFVEMELTSEGFSRAASRPSSTPAKPFTIEDFQTLDEYFMGAGRHLHRQGEPFTLWDWGIVADRLSYLAHYGFDHGWSLTNISIQRSGWSRKGGVTIEMRTSYFRTHDWWRKVFELDGTTLDSTKG